MTAAKVETLEEREQKKQDAAKNRAARKAAEAYWRLSLEEKLVQLEELYSTMNPTGFTAQVLRRNIDEARAKQV